MWNKLIKILSQILNNIKNAFQQIMVQIGEFIKKDKQYFYLLLFLILNLLVFILFWNIYNYVFILSNEVEPTQIKEKFFVVKDIINYLPLKEPRAVTPITSDVVFIAIVSYIVSIMVFSASMDDDEDTAINILTLSDATSTNPEDDQALKIAQGTSVLFATLAVFVFNHHIGEPLTNWIFHLSWVLHHDTHLMNIQDFHFIDESSAVEFYDNPDIAVQCYKIRNVTEQINTLLGRQQWGKASVPADLEKYRMLLQERHKLIWELYCKQTNQEIPFVEQVIPKTWWMKYLKFTSLLIFSRFPRIHNFIYLLKLTFTAKKAKIKIMNLNFGPQHPSAHGVLRLILDLNGEIIKKATPHIGLLHRGTEKLVEYKTYQQSLPYFDRLDYVSMMAQEHTFSLSVEKMKKIKISLQASLKRIIFLEITRILNHLMAITTHALDVGALTPFLYAFEEREKLFEFYERVSGARMHAAYIRPAGLQYDLPFNMLCDILYFIHSFQSRVNEIEELLSNNRIWKQRLKFVGVLKKNDIKYWSFSGVMSRSVGLNYDIRQDNSYEGYSALWWHAPLGVIGDSFSRYIQRAKEMRNSLYISQFCTNFIKNNKWDISKFKVRFLDKIICSTLPRVLMKSKMEELIKHFKFSSIGYNISTNTIYISTEAPKGEFGVFLASNNSPKPYRLKIKAPGFLHLQGLDIMTKEHLLADAVTIIGTQDIVFGEVDR